MNPLGRGVSAGADSFGIDCTCVGAEAEAVPRVAVVERDAQVATDDEQRCGPEDGGDDGVLLLQAGVCRLRVLRVLRGLRGRGRGRPGVAAQEKRTQDDTARLTALASTCCSTKNLVQKEMDSSKLFPLLICESRYMPRSANKERYLKECRVRIWR